MIAREMQCKHLTSMYCHRETIGRADVGICADATPARPHFDAHKPCAIYEARQTWAESGTMAAEYQNM